MAPSRNVSAGGRGGSGEGAGDGRGVRWGRLCFGWPGFDFPARDGAASRFLPPAREPPPFAMWISVAGRYRSLMIAILATVLAVLAALLHVYIFVMESVQWTQPRIWRRFGLADQSAAEVTKPLAYNQGFYNLFLAIGTAIGLVLFLAAGDDPALRAAGVALVLFALGSMVAAALVLLTTGGKYLRAALLQGTLPLIGFVLFLFA